jgi:hypothetical protein
MLSGGMVPFYPLLWRSSRFEKLAEEDWKSGS